MWNDYAFIPIALFLLLFTIRFVIAIYWKRQFNAAETLRETKLTEQGLVSVGLKNTTFNIVQVT